MKNNFFSSKCEVTHFPPPVFQVQTSSPSPQRSASKFPPRLSYDTSSLHYHPPALTPPARTQRPGRRTRRKRRRRVSKEEEGVLGDQEEEEEEGGEDPLW